MGESLDWWQWPTRVGVQDLGRDDYVWHARHSELFEPRIGPIEDRLEYIKNNFPADELELRERLLKSVQGELPEPLLDAMLLIFTTWSYKEYVMKTMDWAAYVVANQPFWAAHRIYEEMRAIYWPEVLALHEVECPSCPWDGKTIFP